MTLYSQIAHDLRGDIQSGRVRPGDTLPPLRELMQHYGVARDTVRDAVAVLTNEGLVIPRRGIGTIVRDTKPITLHYDPSAPAQTWAQQGGGTDRVMVTEWENADPDTAARLDIEQGASVLHRVRHQIFSGVVAQIVEQWIPSEIVTDIQDQTGLDLAEIEGSSPDDGVNVFISMASAGHAPISTTERQSARMPRPDERDTMEIPPGVAVLITDRRTIELDNRPVEVSRMVGTGDRISTSYTVALHY